MNTWSDALPSLNPLLVDSSSSPEQCLVVYLLVVDMVDYTLLEMVIPAVSSRSSTHTSISSSL